MRVITRRTLGVAGGDTTAIHDNVAAEIDSISEKVLPISTDLILIEDSEDNNNKKKVKIDNLPKGDTGTVATTDTTETTAFTYTTTTDSIAYVTAKITCRRTGGAGVGVTGDGCVYERKVRVKNVAGTVTLGAIELIYTDEDAAISAADVTIDVSGVTARVRVTGLLDVNFTWDVVFVEEMVNS